MASHLFTCRQRPRQAVLVLLAATLLVAAGRASTRPESAEIVRRVRMIIKGDGRFLDTNLELEVTAGLVRLRGLFLDPGDVLMLKHQVASIPGVVDVEIEALLVALGGGTPSPRNS